MKLPKLLRFLWSHPLNRNGRLAAFRRLVAWQSSTRLLPHPVLLPFVDDTVLAVERGMTGATGNWYCGLHEHAEMLFVLRALRTGDLFVDVGANVGSYTVLGAGAVGARTISIEPIPTTFRRLQRNIRVNGLEQMVEAHCLGVSDKEGISQFTDGEDTMNHVATGDELGSCIEVPVTTLDSVLDLRSPAVMKLDVEGHELPVLRGAEKTLSCSSLLAVLLETNESGARYGIHHSDVSNYIERFGFFPFTYDPESGEINPSGPGALNTIFIRDVETVRVRLGTSRRFRLCNGVV